MDQSCIMDSLESDMKLLLDALNFIQDDTDQQIQALKTLATMCSDGKLPSIYSSIFFQAEQIDCENHQH